MGNHPYKILNFIAIIIQGGSDKIQNVSLLCLHKNVEEDTSADGK